MGLLARLPGFGRKAADDAAKTADEVRDAAKVGDDTAGVSNSNDVDLSADQADGFYAGMRTRDKIVHDVAARTAEQPARIVSGTTNNLATITKVGVGGATVAYVGGKAIDFGAMNSQKEAYEALQQRLTEIENNDNLSAEEKAEAKEEARDAYYAAWGGGGGASATSGLLDALGFADSLGTGEGLFGGVLGKLILGMVVVSAIWAAPRALEAIGGN